MSPLTDTQVATKRRLRGRPHKSASNRALPALDPEARPRTRLLMLIRQHLEVCVDEDADFIPVKLLEWRALTPSQRARVTGQKDRYEGVWMPVLTALHDSGALSVGSHITRLYIFSALNWAVRWFDANGRLTLDDMARQAVDLFLRPASRDSTAGQQPEGTRHQTRARPTHPGRQRAAAARAQRPSDAHDQRRRAAYR